jgi:hypothetical protein
MGLVLQSLGNLGLLNHVLMVEIQNDNDGEHQTNIEVVLITDKENIDVNRTDEQGLNTLKMRRHDI